MPRSAAMSSSSGTGTYARLPHRAAAFHQGQTARHQGGARRQSRCSWATTTAGNLARISNSSYIVLDGLTMENSNHPIYCMSVEHLILVNLEAHNSGQEIIHIRGASRYVDIRNCKLYDSGHHRTQWAEGIYIGTGQPPL